MAFPGAILYPLAMTYPRLAFILLLPLLVLGQRPEPTYETRAKHDPDGIGKFYMGREIAHVMGYQGAAWLERPERVDEEQPDRVVEEMRLAPTDIVADVGAGTGYFSFRFARVVAKGKVYAVDIQPQMLAMIEARKKQTKVENVVGIRSTETSVNLPDGAVDVVFFADV
mgnify:CR=1 FL=1